MTSANTPMDNPHIEQHFTATETVRDIIVGMSGGLTVPFALAAGLTGALSTSSIIKASANQRVDNRWIVYRWGHNSSFTLFCYPPRADGPHLVGGVYRRRIGHFRVREGTSCRLQRRP